VLGTVVSPELELEEELEEPGVGWGVCAKDAQAQIRANRLNNFGNCMKGFACMNYSDMHDASSAILRQGSL
jgi:hypothetical protein